MDEEIVRLTQRCLAEVIKETARRCGGDLIEQDGLLLVAGNHPCPVLLNSALRTGTMDATEALRRAEAFFGERRHRYETWTREGADADLEKAALAAGMHLAAELSGMVLHRSPDVPKSRPDVEVRRVEDMDGVQDFINVAAEGFRDETPCLYELVRATFSDPRSILAPDTVAFVVWNRGEPVSTALTMVKEGIAWIGWVATLPGARGRGLGRIATAAATQEGFALGAAFASLEATRMGVTLYSKLGYREVLRYRNYWPADFLG